MSKDEFSKMIAIGTQADFDFLLRHMAEEPGLGYRVSGVVRTKEAHPGNKHVHVDIQQVRNLIALGGVDQLVFSSSYQLDGSFRELEDICRRNRIAMRIISPESEELFSRAGFRNATGIPVYIPRSRHLRPLKEMMKRGLDILGALAGLTLLSPLFALIALVIKLESRGPVFFRQPRSMAAGEPCFDLIKFRSMRQGAHEERKDLEKENNSNGALFKMREDPRVTRFGRFLRRFSLDELPQLINVLKGEMSLVGPRPLPIEDYGLVTEEDHLEGFLYRRAQAKPGMTGIWQVSGRSELDFREMVLLDMYYIENQSLLFDIKLLIQTLPAVLLGRGAY